METFKEIDDPVAGQIRAQHGATVLVGSLVLALLLMGAAFCVWAFGPDGLEEKAEQVQPGMTKSEVEAIFGTPPNIDSIMQTWFSDRVVVWVNYHGNGRLWRAVANRIPLCDRIRAKLPW